MKKYTIIAFLIYITNITTAFSAPVTIQYRYDDLNRMVSVYNTDNNNDTGYSHDEVGNILSRSTNVINPSADSDNDGLINSDEYLYI